MFKEIFEIAAGIQLAKAFDPPPDPPEDRREYDDRVLQAMVHAERDRRLQAIVEERDEVIERVASELSKKITDEMTRHGASNEQLRQVDGAAREFTKKTADEIMRVAPAERDEIIERNQNQFAKKVVGIMAEEPGWKGRNAWAIIFVIFGVLFVMYALLSSRAAQAGGCDDPVPGSALSIEVLKTDRSNAGATYLLLQVQNASDQRLDTRWSCVFLDGEVPVYEERTSLDNVPPHDHAVKRDIFGYGGAFSKVECRWMSSRRIRQ